ncbi:MAG: Fic family protein [Actinomycetales bacterium]|nr:Fic family protein [Actinomycetales bacterium]
MPRLVDSVWPGNPTGSTRAARRTCRFHAYVPDPLVGRDVDLPAGLAADLVDVETAVRRLNATSGLAVNLEPLARFLLRAEAVASSNIEGLHMNVRRLARSEAEVREGWTSSDETAAAVLGNIRALDQSLELASDIDQPITVETIRAIHVALLTGTRDEPWAGVIREEQNWIGGASPCSAAFVPPPAAEVPALLDDLAEYLSGDDHPALLQAALAHSQFETIHPFADGNGRTGRALIQLVLRRRGLATTVVPPVSLVLATETTRYVDALMATRAMESSQSGHLAWTELFVEATARACRDSVAFGRDLADLERANRVKLGRVRTGSTADRLVAALPALPVFTVKTASAFIARSDVAVGAAVKQLLEAGVIHQVTVGRRNRAFEAVGLFEAFTGFERMQASPDSDTARTPPVRPVPTRPDGP